MVIRYTRFPDGDILCDRAVFDGPLRTGENFELRCRTH